MVDSEGPALAPGTIPSFTSPWRRFAAFFLDWMLIGTYIAAIFSLNMTIDLFGNTDNIALLQLLDFLALTFPVILYFSVLESSPWQGTLGKRRLRIQVVSTDGGRLTFGRAFARSILKFLPWQLTHTFLRFIPGWPAPTAGLPSWVGAGFILVWVLVFANLAVALKSRTRQTIYDHIIGSDVIDGRI